MYPPPQSLENVVPFFTVPTQSMDSNHRHDHRLFKSHGKSHSHIAPFSYEYIIQDGHLPYLTEHHPVRKDEQLHPQLLFPQPEIKRHQSLRRTQKSPQLQSAPQPAAAPLGTSTKDKLKRALSLSGGKHQSHARTAGPKPSHSNASVPQRQTSNQHAAGSFLVPPTPRITIPTPSSSPEPYRNSFASSVQSSNFSQARSSWTSMDDEQRDLALMQYYARGRLTPSPVHVVERNRDKALARLGITDLPMTPPFTPLPSKTSSVCDQYVLQPEQWRRPSVESRLSREVPVHLEEGPIKRESRRSREMSRPVEHRPVVQMPKADLITPVGSDHELPKLLFKPQPQEAADQIEQRTEPQTERATERPPPTLRRKTSRFIEHIETAPESAPAPAPVPAPKPSPVQIHFSRPFPQAPRQALQRSGSTMTALGPRSVNIQGPKRSESMRQPLRGSGQWGAAVVCTAEARSVVASGTAKLVVC